MKIKITADSTCDLSPELIQKYDIGVIPLYIVCGDETFKDGVGIVPQDIYDFVEGGHGACRTAAVNVVDYLQIFQSYMEEYDALIHIDLSSEMSACYQNALIAAKELNNVYVVDSRNLTSGVGHLAIDAALWAQEGLEPEEIYRRLLTVQEKLESSFVINTLEYLRSGGRCSALAALGANLLKLKPCIEVVDGKMKVVKKYRGSFDHVIGGYVRDRLENRNDIDWKRVFITHTGVSEAAMEQVLQALEKYGQFQEIIETRAGCTISVHSGPNTLGILFYRK